MLRKGNKSLLLWMVFFLSACGQIELVESPWDKSSTPFIYSVITPSEPVTVFLGQNIISEDSVETTPYPDAKVFLCEEGEPWIELERLENDSNYFINNDIVVYSGKTYLLKVEFGNGKSPLLAKTTVPTVSAKILNASYLVYDTTTWFVGNGIGWVGSFKAEWNVLEEKEYGYLLYDCTWINDFVQGEFKCTSNITDLSYPKDSVNFKLYLATTDINLKKWIRNKQIQDSQHFEPGMLFLDVALGSFGGISPNFSNVENGIGLFGSYLVEETTFKIDHNEAY